MKKFRKHYLFLLLPFLCGWLAMGPNVLAGTDSTIDIVPEISSVNIDDGTDSTDTSEKNMDTPETNLEVNEAASELEAIPEDNSGENGEDSSKDDVDPSTSPQAPSDLYLNGESGNDENDGSSTELAVRTFEKAKQIAREKGIQNIYVAGTTSIEGEINLAETKAKLLRHKDFNNYLLKVESGKEATLTNITIDGNSENNPNIEKSLIQVNSGATLNIEKGAVLRNNKIKPDERLNPTKGGAIDAQEATINMSEGSVEDNQATYGGGIHLNKSTMNFTGGAVQNNQSELVFDKPYNQYYSAGGGIIVREGSVLNMSGDAKVLNNFAAEIGGGISIGSNNPEKGSTLNMSGGTVDGNTAGASGGGIFIQAKYFSGSQGRAYITAGQITNNKMDGTGKTNMAFGGGGIYVNGAPEQYGANGELYLQNVLITDNISEWEGAGLANCPISETTIYVNNGGALYGNQSKDSKQMNDLYILSYDDFGIHSGQAKYKLSKWMLGGAPYNWMLPNGDKLADEMHQGTLARNSQLGLNVNSKGNNLTKSLTRVIISGNYSATRGGGIGSNGSVTIGTDDETTEVSVEKQWDDNNNANNKRPDTVQVQLLAKIGKQEYLVETKDVTENHQWKVTFENLPTKSGETEITYTVREVSIEDYESRVSGDLAKGFIITNKEKPEEPKTRDLHVTKAWNLVGTDHPVEAIEVELYRNGVATGQTLTLFASNEWQGTFHDLALINPTDSTEYVYTAKEVGEAEGRIQFGERQFDVAYTGTMADGFTITNQEIERTRDIHITKVWDLVGSEHPVEQIEVELYRNGEATGQTLTLSTSNKWQGTFRDLALINPANSTEYVYTVKEVGEANGLIQFGERQFDVTYTRTMADGFTIINQEIERTRDLHVTKAWDLVGTEHPFEAIEVELYRNGVATGQTLTLSASNEWQGTFHDLALINPADSTEYVYTVKEVGEAKGRIQFGERQFDVTYKGTMADGFTITNQEIERTRDLHVSKVWHLVGTNHRVEQIEVELYRNGEATGQTLTLSASNEWQGTFHDLALINPDDSTEYVYTVKEVGEANGLIQFGERQFDVTYTGTMIDGFTIENKEKPTTPPDIPEEPGEPEEPPTPPEIPEEPGEPEKPSAPENPRKQLPPTGEVMSGYVLVGLLLIMNAIIVFTLIDFNEDY